MSTIAFPVAFLVTSLFLLQGSHDVPLAIDAGLLSFPIALLVWPAHALTMIYLRRRETRRVPYVLVSVVAGVVSVGALYPFQAVFTQDAWDVVKIGFPLMYWLVAVLATWVGFRLLAPGRWGSWGSVRT